MPRVTFVKKAQQRFATVPVIDPETGEQKRTPVMRADGSQKTTKTGRLVFMDVTRADKAQPLPNLTCGKCHEEIKVGDPYKWIKPKSGPYGGRTMVRCDTCPTWQVWEYSSSTSARLAEIQHDFQNEVDGADAQDTVTSALESMAEAIKEIAEEKRDGASNIEEGFGHATSASEELEQIASDLDSWADDIEGADVPATEDYACEDCSGSGTVECETCSGEGTVDDGRPCQDCKNEDGTSDGQVECSACGGDEDWFDQDAWAEAVQEAISITEDCPV